MFFWTRTPARVWTDPQLSNEEIAQSALSKRLKIFPKNFQDFWKPVFKKKQLFFENSKNVFHFFSIVIFEKAHSKLLCYGSSNFITFFCLKEHMKTQGMTLLFF